MKEKTRLNFLWINFSMASKDLGRYLIQWSTSLHYLYQKLSIQRKTEESTTEHQKVLLFNRFCCAPPLWPLYQKCQIYHHDAFLDSFYIKMLTTFPEKNESSRLSSTSKIFQTFVHGLTLPFLNRHTRLVSPWIDIVCPIISGPVVIIWW